MFGWINDIKDNIRRLKLALKAMIITQILTFLIVLALLIIVIINH